MICTPDDELPTWELAEGSVMWVVSVKVEILPAALVNQTVMRCTDGHDDFRVFNFFMAMITESVCHQNGTGNLAMSF